MLQQHIYPEHLYDPFRRSTAVEYIQHEMRKLFPGIKDRNLWEMIDRDIRGWYSENPTLMPVRDFWNGLHAISHGFRLKNIVSFLTSKNIAWHEEEVRVQALSFGSYFEEFEPLGIMPTVVAVHDWFFDPKNKEALEIARTKSKEQSVLTVNRDDDRIFVVHKGEHLRVIDGNRRVLNTVLFGQKTIIANIGEPIAEPMIYDAWVPTSTLVDLVSFHRYFFENNHQITERIAKVVAQLIETSTAGQHEFRNYAISSHLQEDQTLLEEVEKELLSSSNIVSTSSTVNT
ncbi:hypothetical protein CO172_03890 [Candidatus Uhrbacteria bacterium CG_4_9_14_3_um_filter_36_7]|uniref:Uncharacterized protein n=1 Tax=Candidatus Uhrbacteria bacterium CG_4_9_14_3_um_filter_36_7 TaxID=1975033 RepID=A0A2M7XEN9_9BACT|nr:MAG: hypothetical protein CO172_03890 [Candidatus Uhrbacteria bacterium CG_4_9_14_3_um_filter_36_7]